MTLNIDELKEKARKIRCDIVEMTCRAQSGHPGGSLSATDILTVLYFNRMHYDVKHPELEERDRFILSKGHAAPVLYATLAEAGFFSKEYLKTLRQIGSSLQGHPDMLSLPGIEISSGSLGQGLSVANGMALGLKLDKNKARVYVLIGDGESQEGQIWEAAMTSAHYKLDNLVAILDHNKFQIDGSLEEVKSITPVADKWRAFGFEVIDKVNGHDLKDLVKAFEKAEKVKGKPTMIIADTIKGKGISFMENNNSFHGKAATPEEKEKAMGELCQIITCECDK